MVPAIVKVYPYIGVNDLKFLMSPVEVNQTLGPALSIAEISKEVFCEIRNGNKSYYKNNRLLSVSYQGNCVVEINNTVYSLPQDGKKFLANEKPALIHGNYTCAHYGIAIYGLDYPDSGIETTIYASERKPDFEDGSAGFTMAGERNGVENLSRIFLLYPYKGVGPLKFGMNSHEVENALGIPEKVLKMNSGELREVRGEIQTRYNKEGKLVQVSLNDEMQVILNGEDISKHGWKSNMLKNKEAFMNRAYKVYFSYGVSMSGYDKANEAKSIVIFSEEMVALWKNIYRPLL